MLFSLIFSPHIIVSFCCSINFLVFSYLPIIPIPLVCVIRMDFRGKHERMWGGSQKLIKVVVQEDMIG